MDKHVEPKKKQGDQDPYNARILFRQGWWRWRGSEAFYNAWLMGWPRVSVFDGGWFEWSNDPENPFETGVPE